MGTKIAIQQPEDLLQLEDRIVALGKIEGDKTYVQLKNIRLQGSHFEFRADALTVEQTNNNRSYIEFEHNEPFTFNCGTYTVYDKWHLTPIDVWLKLRNMLGFLTK